MKKLILALVLCVSCSAQGAAPVPTLTPEKKSELVITLQRVALAQNAAKLATDQAAKEEQEALALLKSLTVTGYTLRWSPDLRVVEYVKDAAPEAAAKK